MKPMKCASTDCGKELSLKEEDNLWGPWAFCDVCQDAMNKDVDRCNRRAEAEWNRADKDEHMTPETYNNIARKGDLE